MLNINLYHDKRKPSASDVFPVFITLCHKGSKSFLSTGIKFSEVDFLSVKSGHADSQHIRKVKNHLDRIRLELEDTAFELERQDTKPTPSAVKTAYIERNNPELRGKVIWHPALWLHISGIFVSRDCSPRTNLSNETQNISSKIRYSGSG